VRLQLPGRPPNEDITGTLTHAGTLALRLRPLIDALAPADGRPLKVKVSYGPPGARAPESMTVAVKLRRLPAPPLPQILNLRVQRAGKNLVVRWDTDVPTGDAYFDVIGTRTSNLGEDPRPVSGTPRGKSRRHYRVTLKNAARVRYVTVKLGAYVGRSGRTQTIQVG
jgi:hypothetical protein